MEQTIEGNKLIAEFMGCKPILEHGNIYDMNYMQDSPHCWPEDMLYHDSWEWIMPVLDEIVGKRGVGYYEITADKKQKCFAIHLVGDSMMDPSFAESEKDSKKATFKGVVAFIKWYNENRK